ncbi:MAG: DNA internalization-related competence protein ComEC/Rec2 [Woeseiaceae bacterium]
MRTLAIFWVLLALALSAAIPPVAWLVPMCFVSVYWTIVHEHFVIGVLAATTLFAVVMMVVSGHQSASDRLLHSALNDVVVRVPVLIDSLGRQTATAQSWQVTTSDPSLPKRLVLIATSGSLDLQPGDCWRLPLRLRQVHTSSNPNAFDRQQWLAQQGVGASALLIDLGISKRCDDQPGSYRWTFVRRVAAALAQIPAEDHVTGLLLALATGERANIAEDSMAMLRDSGTAHLLAISGLHVGLVAAIGYWLGRWIPWKNESAQQDIAGFFGLVLASSYVWLAGFTLPTQRAWIMLLLVWLSFRFRQRISLLDLVAAATISVVLKDPQVLSGASFWLSFSAVAILGVASRVREASLQSENGRVQTVLLAQVLLSLALAPMTSAWFGQWSYIGLIANLFMVPVFGCLLVPLVLIATVATLLVPGVAQPCWAAAAYFVDRVLWLLQFLTDITGAVRPVAAMDAWYACLLCGLCAVAALMRYVPGRALMLSAGSCMLALQSYRVPSDCLEVTLLDVGHGTALHMAGPDWHALYDTGPAWFGGGSAAASIIQPYLVAMGRTAPAFGMVSHADSDHVGGAPLLMQALSGVHWIGNHDDGMAACVRGQRWSIDDVRFEVLWPIAGLSERQWSENNRSCVLQITIGDAVILLTGDIEHAAEQEVTAMRLLSPVMVLAPHHGSRTSSSRQLVNALRAKEVWVSAAARGRWQLPHPTVARRWQSANAVVRNTGMDGALRGRFCRGQMAQIGVYRERKNDKDLW